MTAARGFTVTGRVQGVGYRAFVARNAQALGLVGWVRNTEDGAVEGVAEGPESALDALVAQLRAGPRAASVRNVDVTSAAPTALRGFEIRR